MVLRRLRADDDHVDPRHLHVDVVQQAPNQSSEQVIEHPTTGRHGAGSSLGGFDGIESSLDSSQLCGAHGSDRCFLIDRRLPEAEASADTVYGDPHAEFED